MSKDSKNTENSFPIVVKTLIIMALIAVMTYALMAVITHFSLHFESDNYLFSESLKSVFDTKTAIFKFFVVFMILNIVWLSLAVSIYYIKKQFFIKNEH